MSGRDVLDEDDKGPSSEADNCDFLRNREIMILILIVLGTVFAVVILILLLRFICRRCYGKTCKITWEDELSSNDYATDDELESRICEAQPKRKESRLFELAPYGFNRSFTPAPGDPIYTITQPGVLAAEHGEFVQYWELNEPRGPGQQPDQYTYVYDGRLKSPKGKSTSLISGDSGLAYRVDQELHELSRIGMMQSETITLDSKLVVFISREVNHLGDTLVLSEMGISLSISPNAIEAGRTELVSLILDWDLGDFPGMTNSETIVSPVVHCGPHGLKLNKPAILSYKHCAYELGNVSLVASETHFMQTKDWKEVCDRNDRSRPFLLLEDEIQVKVSHFTLYTCLAEGKTSTKKWMQLAVFGGKMRPKQHYEIRLYFLNNTPCALQFAIQNEAKNHFKLLCPRKEFLFHGDGEDILATIQHVNEGWSHLLEDRQERVLFLSLWHGKCPSVSFIFKHENEQVRDIDIRLLVHQRGREANEEDKTILKVLASMRSKGTPGTVIEVFPPNKVGKKRTHGNRGSVSSRTVSIRSAKSTSSNTSSCASSSSSSSTSTNHTSEISSENGAVGVSSDPSTQQPCYDGMQIHIHQTQSTYLPIPSSHRTIPHELCMELVVLLDPLHPLGNDWRILASALEMDSLIPLLKNTPSYNPTVTLLEEVEHQNKSLEWLASVMMKAKRLDAANVVMLHENKKTMKKLQNTEKVVNK